MKKIILPVLLALSFAACENQMLDQISNDETQSSTTALNSRIKKNNLDVDVVLRDRDKGLNTYKVGVILNPDFIDHKELTVRLEFSLPDSKTENRIHKPILFTKKIDKSTPILWSIEPVEFNTSLENKIINVAVVYESAGVKVYTNYYSIFVDESGKIQLQKPTFRTINWTWVDGGISAEDDWEAPMSLIVDNDPANVVAAVEYAFVESKSEELPTNPKGYLKIDDNYVWTKSNDQREGAKAYSTTLTFNRNPYLNQKKIALCCRDAKGNMVGDTQILTLENKNVDAPKIKYLFAKQNSENELAIDFLTISENTPNEKEAYSIEITAIKPFNGLEFLNNKTIIYRIRKRPEMLSQEWDTLVDSGYLSEFMENPLAICSYNEHHNPLSDMRSTTNPSGGTINVIAYIKNKKGEIINAPQLFTVKIAPALKINKEEFKIIGVRTFSYDKGQTWSVQVTIDDIGNWVNNINVKLPSFNNQKLTDLNLIEKKGTIETYIIKGVKLEGNPLEIEMPVNIYLFGSGTRTSAGQASSKAELL